MAEEQAPREERRSATPFIIAGVAVALIGAAIFIFQLSNQLDQLSDRLEASEEREQRLERRMEETGERLYEFRSKAAEALERADTEAERARAIEIQKDLAEWERELARQRAQDAERQAAEALTVAESSREEAERNRRLAEEQQAEAQRSRRLAEEKQAEAEQRKQEAEESRKEFERLQTARRRELDRMEEALSQIVDTERTPLGMVMRLSEDSLQFDFDDAAIREEDKELLSRIAGVLLASHGYRLYIYGHTDDQGRESYNEKLSLRRAKAVEEYFAKAGIPEELMQSEGFGSSDPRAPGKSEEARQKNRRVEIGVVDTVIDFEDLPSDMEAQSAEAIAN